MKKSKSMPKCDYEVGSPEGGKKIQTPKAGKSEKVIVKGTKTLKKQSATWY